MSALSAGLSSIWFSTRPGHQPSRLLTSTQTMSPLLYLAGSAMAYTFATVTYWPESESEPVAVALKTNDGGQSAILSSDEDGIEQCTFPVRVMKKNWRAGVSKIVLLCFCDVFVGFLSFFLGRPLVYTAGWCRIDDRPPESDGRALGRRCKQMKNVMRFKGSLQQPLDGSY